MRPRPRLALGDWTFAARVHPRSDGAICHDLLFRIKKGDRARLNRASESPSAKGCSGFVKTAGAIYLASVFGRGREARVLRSIECLDGVLEVRGGLWCSRSCSANLLRAYTVHPDASRGRAIARAVRSLGRIQTPHESWPGMPFAATFEALAQLDSREAKAQIKRAVGRSREENPEPGRNVGPRPES